MLKKIGANARYEIEKQLDTKVNLQLWVKVKKEWRDSDVLIKNFGYDKKKAADWTTAGVKFDARRLALESKRPLDSCPLYFRYKGKGTLDILSITLA